MRDAKRSAVPPSDHNGSATATSRLATTSTAITGEKIAQMRSYVRFLASCQSAFPAQLSDTRCGGG